MGSRKDAQRCGRSQSTPHAGSRAHILHSKVRGPKDLDQKFQFADHSFFVPYFACSIWIGGSFVAQFLMSDSGSDMPPFLLTYLATSLFTLYLPLVHGSQLFSEWWRSRWAVYIAIAWHTLKHNRASHGFDHNHEGSLLTSFCRGAPPRSAFGAGDSNGVEGSSASISPAKARAAEVLGHNQAMVAAFWVSAAPPGGHT